MVIEGTCYINREREKGEKGRVCVTGAGGYCASWVVKLLLSKGYTVHETVRDPDDEKKNGHLKKMENSSNLQLFHADVMDYDSLSRAISGCEGVFHAASPVPSGQLTDFQKELVDPPVKGALNVLKASHEAGIKRVVLVSSMAAVVNNPKWPKDIHMDETCWSEMPSCKTAEVTRDYPRLEGKIHALVDVRDVAEALLLVYENPKAAGRYIWVAYSLKFREMAEIIKRRYPNFEYTTEFTDEKGNKEFNSEKLKSLGWKFRPLEDTLVDFVEYLHEAGLLKWKESF
ncbi:cinnamoyl-CoA reductase 2-like [Amborella trichopoda]|uniref:cinnamoyl-CoA reductase 2-like n=1 Tax=Amborella trichopoda TaxID=13333 RepID=UPI0009BDC9E8|nr:cinnamoyl-CoA reductase 2-like [Amborella trichopoda]|eukprot:XP_020526415.1 cinnamoyl-CoA reductase 2-like [Amborella trichopoda]